MNVVDACAGVGGFSLGLKLAGTPARTVCYLEREAFCVAVLARQMQAGYLDSAPVWSDLRTFDARPWRGIVDLVTAGFPCQPFSHAGKLKREQDERHLWPDIARIVRECRPAGVFLENVSLRAFLEPLRDLRAMGFEVPPALRVSASDVGAPHRRDRWFVLATHPERELLRKQPSRGRGPDREGAPQPGEHGPQGHVSNSDRRRREGIWSQGLLDQPQQPPAQRAHRGTRRWEAEPPVCGVVDGSAAGVDRPNRLRALGNGVVPLAVATAWKELTS